MTKRNHSIRFASDRTGSVPIVTAAFMGVAVVAASFAIDLGMLYLQRRAAQGAADLAAMAAAADIANADAAARATLAANGLEDLGNVSVVKGRYEPDPAVAPALRFSPGSEPHNAVKVDLGLPGNIYFAHAFLDRSVAIGVSALASSAGEATFSLGSGLVSVNGGLANGVLGGLLGTTVSLDAVHYDGLLNANVQLLSFMDALATELGVTAGTYQDVLATQATVGDVLGALATVTSANGNAAASAALTSLLNSGGSSLDLAIPLSTAIDLGPLATVTLDQPAPGFDATVGVMDMLANSVVLANGERHLVIDLGASVPGVANVKLEIVAGEPMQTSPWVAVGQTGSVLRTAQFRLRLVARVLGTGVLSSTSLNVPVYLELADASARLASVTCIGGAERAEVAALPGVAKAWLGVPANTWTSYAQSPAIAKAQIVDTSLIKVLGSAEIDVGSVHETMLEFDEDDIAAGTKKRAVSQNLVESLVTSLIQHTSFEVSIGGFSLVSPALVQSAVAATLQPVTGVLDTTLSSILATLGVQPGIADVRVNGIRCRPAVLSG